MISLTEITHSLVNTVCIGTVVCCDGHVLRGESELEVKGQMKKTRLQKTWKKQVMEESMKVGMSRDGAACRSK